MPAIIITPSRVNCIDFEGRPMAVRHLLFEKEGLCRNLHTEDSFEDVTPLEIRLVVRNSVKSLLLPTALIETTGRFLEDHQGRPHELDCYDFVCLVAGVALNDKLVLFKYWKRHQRLFRRPGDVIFLVNQREHRFRHAAIYLGYGLYISVYGKGGDLEVATLRDMKRNFGARDVLTMISRRN